MNTSNNFLASMPTEEMVNKSNKTFKGIYERLCKKEATIALVGLGYVGLPIALEFAKSFKVIGYDINDDRVDMMKNGVDPSGELSKDSFKNVDIQFTSVSETLDKADVIVVAVPTPVSKDNQPNLKPLQSACEKIAVSLGEGNIVIFESTVYPGCTEEVCIPILEKISGLTYNVDFKVGYSPERINPGDKVHTLTQIKKIVSGSDEIAGQEIYKIYDHIIEAGIHLAPTMKVAEAAKIIENTQRDVNIALMNELSGLFDELSINTQDVLKAAGTKWNFLNFYPGLVGGHCIGVDPYYLIHKAADRGMILPVISSSRYINDSMPQQVVDRIEVALRDLGKTLETSKVLVLGATFKENVSDLRNSKAAEMSQLLKASHCDLHVHDPHASSEELRKYYSLEKTNKISGGYDVIVYAVNHQSYEDLDWEYIQSIGSESMVVFDFKKILGKPRILNDKVAYITL